MRLPRSMRMRKRSEFQLLRKEGKTIRGRFLVLSRQHRPGLGVPFRCAIILTKKSVRRAVGRNRIRRRLRSVISECGENITPEHLFILIGRYNVGEASFDDLRRDWLRLARKTGLLAAKEQASPNPE